jgi:predicted acyl esterase
MSDTTPAPAAPAQTQTQPGENQGGNSGNYTPPASQADLDRIVADRLSRERAKYADYDDLKTKASEYDKVAEAQKTAEQKAAEALAEAQSKVKEYETREQVATWKSEVEKASGVPAAALAGSSLEEIQAHAETLKPLIAPPADTQPRKGAIGPYVPTEGKTPAVPLNSDALEDALRAKLGIS